jgi:hypothetical protein
MDFIAARAGPNQPRLVTWNRHGLHYRRYGTRPMANGASNDKDHLS